MATDVSCCGAWFWLYAVVIVVLVCFAGLMAGLTLGLMSLGLVDLEVLIKSGRPLDRIHAAKIFPVVKNQHLLLCTLLIGNSLAMEALPIFLDKLVPPWAAVLFSVTLVLMFGEILPQAVCTRYGMAVGAAMVPFVRLLLVVFFPISYPISKVLDWMLGKGHDALWRRAELKTFVSFHGNEAGKGGDLSQDETNVIAGALELTEKTAKDAMTPIEQTFSLDLDGKFDLQTLNLIIAEGHSRVPVYIGNPKNLIGLILVKSLLTLRPNDAIPFRQMSVRKIPRVLEDMPLYDILNEFQNGHSHMAVVIKDSNGKREPMMKIKELRYFDRKLKTEMNKAMLDTSHMEGVKLGNFDPHSVDINRETDRNSSNRYPLAPMLKRRQRKGFDCLLDLDHAPVPIPPPNEEVVGVITMEDVIEELIQAEILDETDKYINIHNRIKINMLANPENAGPCNE